MILNLNAAYYGTNKFASGNWTPTWRWEGNWLPQYGGGDGFYLQSSDDWKEYRNGYLRKTFRHIQSIHVSEFEVILHLRFMWAFVLTDDCAYYNRIPQVSEKNGAFLAIGKVNVVMAFNYQNSEELQLIHGTNIQMGTTLKHSITSKLFKMKELLWLFNKIFII